MPGVDVLTLNTHMGFDVFKRRHVLPDLREAIRAVGADVVFLQEVLGAHAGHARRYRDWPDQPQYEFLADALWPQHAYGRNFVSAEGHQGNALLSRFPITGHDNIDVSLQGHEPRGLLHCVLDVAGSHLHTICVHLGLRESHRMRQLRSLLEFIDDAIPSDAPLVVAGDFNDWRRRGHAYLTPHGLDEPFELAHGRLAATFPASWPLLALDRIYLRNASAQQARVLSGQPWSRLSDHVPLSAQVLF